MGTVSPARIDLLIRIAVVLTITGLLLLVPILITVSGAAVGMFMLGSVLIVLGIGLYVAAVLHGLRLRRAI
jgi:hypothetical protein